MVLGGFFFSFFFILLLLWACSFDGYKYLYYYKIAHFFSNATIFLNYQVDIKKVVLIISVKASFTEEKAKFRNKGGMNYESCKMESNEGNGDIAESYQPPF
jgi:hypothetical protein